MYIPNSVLKYSLVGISALSAFCSFAHYGSIGWQKLESTSYQLVTEEGRKLAAPILRSTGLIETSPANGMDPKVIVAREAQEQGLSAKLIEAIITVESNWKQDAINFNPSLEPKLGKMKAADFSYMQVNGQWLNSKLCNAKNYTELFDPETNIRCGTQILKDALQQTSGNVETALVVYNCGRVSCVKGVEYSKKIAMTLLNQSLR